MELLWWGILAFLLTIGMAWVFLPLLGVAVPWRAQLEDDDARKLLRREKAKVLRQIKDLEHELDAGTITSEEFTRYKTAAMEEAVLINRRLDAIGVETEAEADPREAALAESEKSS